MTVHGTLEKILWEASYSIYKGNDGMDHGLIVDTIESTAQWQTSGATVNADRSWDGDYNTPLMDDTGTSPAKNWVDGRSAVLPGDWYDPSIDELSLLWHNRFHVNKALSEGSHTLLSNTACYWSSTEFSSTVAWALYFGTGTNINGSLATKTNTHTVRAVRAF